MLLCLAPAIEEGPIEARGASIAYEPPAAIEHIGFRPIAAS
jgi:hypothetical protein